MEPHGRKKKKKKTKRITDLRLENSTRYFSYCHGKIILKNGAALYLDHIKRTLQYSKSLR